MLQSIGRNIYEHSDPNNYQIQEYCYNSSVGENVRALSKILRNKINPRDLVKKP